MVHVLIAKCNRSQGLISVEDDGPRDVVPVQLVNLLRLNIPVFVAVLLLVCRTRHHHMTGTSLRQDLTSTLQVQAPAALVLFYAHDNTHGLSGTGEWYHLHHLCLLPRLAIVPPMQVLREVQECSLRLAANEDLWYIDRLTV